MLQRSIFPAVWWDSLLPLDVHAHEHIYLATFIIYVFPRFTVCIENHILCVFNKKKSIAARARDFLFAMAHDMGEISSKSQKCMQSRKRVERFRLSFQLTRDN